MSTTCHHHPHAFTFPKSKDSSLSITSKIKNPSLRYWGSGDLNQCSLHSHTRIMVFLDFLQEFPANLLKVNLNMQHDGGGKAHTDNLSLNIRSTVGLKWIPATSKGQCWCKAKHKPEMSLISFQCFENMRLTSKLGHPICCLLWSHATRLSWSSPLSLLLSKFSTVKVSRSNQYIAAVVSSLGPNNECIPCLCRVTWQMVGNWKLAILLEPSMPHWGRTRSVTLGYLGVRRSHWSSAKPIHSPELYLMWTRFGATMAWTRIYPSLALHTNLLRSGNWMLLGSSRKALAWPDRVSEVNFWREGCWIIHEGPNHWV